MAKEFDPREIADAIMEEVLEIVQADARAILRGVVLATPVGNPYLWKNPPPPGYQPGTARGNWEVTIGTPIGLPDLSKRDTVGGATIAEGFAVIAAYGILGTGLVLENNVPYIGALNDGHSEQAPAGFIEQAQAAVLENDRGRELLP